MNLCKTLYVLIMLLVQSVWSMPALTSVALHDSVGICIDSLENEKYGIFGHIPGFYLAKVYQKNDQQYTIHLFRQLQGVPWLEVHNISEKEFVGLEDSLLLRISHPFLLDSSITLYDLSAQSPIENMQSCWVQLTDNSELYCTITALKNDTLVLSLMNNSHLLVPDQLIWDVHASSVLALADQIPSNYSRHFFLLPAGVGMEKGQVILSDFMMFYPVMWYGITDFLSVMGGKSFETHVNQTHSCASVQTSFHISKSLQGNTGCTLLTFKEDEHNLVMAYTTLTLKDRRNSSLTIGPGVANYPGNVKVPLLTIGGMYRLSKNITLVTENWLVKDNRHRMLSAGLRCALGHLFLDLAWMQTYDIIKDDQSHTNLWQGISYYF